MGFTTPHFCNTASVAGALVDDRGRRAKQCDKDQKVFLDFSTLAKKYSLCSLRTPSRVDENILASSQKNCVSYGRGLSIELCLMLFE